MHSEFQTFMAVATLENWRGVHANYIGRNMFENGRYAKDFFNISKYFKQVFVTQGPDKTFQSR
jgi:hypothetical protein